MVCLLDVELFFFQLQPKNSQMELGINKLSGGCYF